MSLNIRDMRDITVTTPLLQMLDVTLCTISTEVVSNTFETAYIQEFPGPLSPIKRPKVFQSFQSIVFEENIIFDFLKGLRVNNSPGHL